MLTTSTPRIHGGVVYNSRCYKFGLKHPRAGRYWHHQDHGDAPCGGFYSARFPLTMQYSRTFRQNDIDDTKSEMVISANKDQIFHGAFSKRLKCEPNDVGPTEIVSVTVDFYAHISEQDKVGTVRLSFDTLSQNMVDTFTDVSCSPFSLTRTIAHRIPLGIADWAEPGQLPKGLPMEWFDFLGPGISASSTFSKSLVNSNIPGQEEYWQWQLLSFEIKWCLTIPLLVFCQTVRRESNKDTDN